MADVYGGPFGTYASMASSGVVDGTGKDEVGAILAGLAALYGITLTAANGVAGSFVLTVGVDSPHPDFDKMEGFDREKLGVELAALWDVIDAADEA